MKVLVDDQLSCRLGVIHEAVELRDAQGRTFGYFHPAVTLVQAKEESLHSPFSSEEIARRQAVPGGQTLGEIWKELVGR